MPKITFGDNPLDHSSKLRGDIKWQKNALQSDKSKFMIFYEDRPLIKTDPTNRDNPKIYWPIYFWIISVSGVSFYKRSIFIKNHEL